MRELMSYEAQQVSGAMSASTAVGFITGVAFELIGEVHPLVTYFIGFGAANTWDYVVEGECQPYRIDLLASPALGLAVGWFGHWVATSSSM